MIKDREALASLDPFGDTMLLTTLHWPDEIRATSELDLPDEDSTSSRPSSRWPSQLVSAMTGEFDADEYKDEYRDALDAGHRVEGRGPRGQGVEEPEETGKLIDLMAALEASVNAAKAARVEPTSRSASPRRKKAPGRQGRDREEGHDAKSKAAAKARRRSRGRRARPRPASARPPDRIRRSCRLANRAD